MSHSNPVTPGSISHNYNNHNLHLPRILCLHGGGTNSRIFFAQCRTIRHHLEPSFRLIFADAPYFITKPGPDVTSVYADWGPFRSWMKPQPNLVHNPFATPDHRLDDVVMPIHETDSMEVIEAIDASITRAMNADDEAGATGEWVGVLGFSQGARIAASLLLREQSRIERAETTYQSMLMPTQGQKFRFAVLLAGRGPLVALDPDTQDFFGREEEIREPILRLPTVHVHGLQDVGLPMHQELLTRCCVEGSTTLVEWDGNHRVPIKTADVAAVVSALMRAYHQSTVM